MVRRTPPLTRMMSAHAPLRRAPDGSYPIASTVSPKCLRGFAFFDRPNPPMQERTSNTEPPILPPLPVSCPHLKATLPGGRPQKTASERLPNVPALLPNRTPGKPYARMDIGPSDVRSVIRKVDGGATRRRKPNARVGSRHKAYYRTRGVGFRPDWRGENSQMDGRPLPILRA